MSSAITVLRIADGFIVRGACFRAPSCCTASGQSFALQGFEVTCPHGRHISWWASIAK